MTVRSPASHSSLNLGFLFFERTGHDRKTVRSTFAKGSSLQGQAFAPRALP